MSDLISRSELIKHFEAIQQQENVVGLEFIAMIDEIKEQPTAYDVDKVVEELKIIKEDALAEYNMGEYNLDNNIGNSISENYRKDMNEGKCFAYDEAIEIVKQGGVSDASHENSKTTYDVDKVIKELNKLDVKAITRYKGGTFGDYEGTDYYIKKSEAIEIVKQGGISDASDYVCEWRLCDEEANVYDTSCRNPHILIEGTPQENNYEFCPYCGKKIKIVGD